MSRRSWVAVTNFKTRVLRLKPEVQILGSSKSIRHTKVEIIRLKSCFLRKKETKLHANLWKTFLNYSVGVRDGFTFVCLMICIWRVNHVTDPVLRLQPCRSWIKNVWCLSSLWWWCPRHVFLLSIHCSRVRAVNLGSYWERSYFGDSTFLSMWAVPGTVIFWISLVLTLPGILPVTLSSPFLVRPTRAPTTTGIISVVISHILLTSNPKSLFLDNFSVNFAKVLPSELLLLF